MMINKRLLMACLAVALLAAGSAHAQFYIRADGAVSRSARADFKDNGNPGLICGDAGCTSAGQFDDFGTGSAVSVGAGTRFAQNGRLDFTAGYRKYKLDQNDKAVPPAKFKADVTSLALMGNLYLELAMGGVTPYLGVGLGAAQNKLGDLAFDDGAGFQGKVAGDSRIGFAYGFMFGFSFPVASHLAFDLAYRYMDLGQVQTVLNQPLTVGAITANYPGASGHLRAHELAFGVRF